MSDLHLGILGQVARQTELEQHDTADHAGDAPSAGRRAYLVSTALRTRARVADAEQRRKQRHHDQGDTQRQITSASRSAESLS